MKYCVGGYSSKCVENLSAIVSMKVNDLRAITIEVDPSGLRINQSRGKCNQQPTVLQQQVMKKWHNEVVLSKTLVESLSFATGNPFSLQNQSRLSEWCSLDRS